MKCQYPTDMTDQQWRKIKPLLPKLSKRGRKPLDRRWVINAIFFGSSPNFVALPACDGILFWD